MYVKENEVGDFVPNTTFNEIRVNYEVFIHMRTRLEMYELVFLY